MARNFSDLDSMKAQLTKMAEAASTVVLAAGFKVLEREDLYFESPLEAMFWLWWQTFYQILDPKRHMTLHPQFGLAPIEGRSYRVDFAIWPSNLDLLSRPGAKYKLVIVELDGHDFHERTKEQVMARNQRDRDLASKGYRVLHFSGSELHRNPVAVFSDAYVAAAEEWQAFQQTLDAGAVDASRPVTSSQTRALREGEQPF